MLLEAAILAGGRSRRFGGLDKGSLVVGGARILDRQLAALRGAGARIRIVGGPRPLAGPDVEHVPDVSPGVGPLGGIVTALDHTAADRTLILACDMPFVTAPFLAWLAAQAAGSDVTVPRDARGLHPLCASWAVSAGPIVRALLEQGERRVGAAVEALRVRLIEGDALAAFDPDGWLLHNINTPDDYARVSAAERRS